MWRIAIASCPTNECPSLICRVVQGECWRVHCVLRWVALYASSAKFVCYLVFDRIPVRIVCCIPSHFCIRCYLVSTRFCRPPAIQCKSCSRKRRQASQGRSILPFPDDVLRSTVVWLPCDGASDSLPLGIEVQVVVYPSGLCCLYTTMGLRIPTIEVVSCSGIWIRQSAEQ